MTKAETRDMLGRAHLTSVPKARAILLEHLSTLCCQSRLCPLEEALGRVLGADVVSPEDLPPYPRSTMDGFAIRAEDSFGASPGSPAYLEIAGEVKMGELPVGKVEKSGCFRIATGGILPGSSDAVMMFEHTVPVDEKMIEVVKSVGRGTNVIRRGEDLKQGMVALRKGHRLRPQDLGLLAGIGIAEVEIYRRPKVGVLSTGDEIVPWNETPPPGKIRDINSISLAASCRQRGALVQDYGIVADDEKTFLNAVSLAVAENDIVLFSGGSSVGVRDLGERVIEKLGRPGVLVHGVALKPGKPIIIGLCGDTAVFGLPGHPVSALVCFELFVVPALEHFSGTGASGHNWKPSVLARLDRNINSAAGRLDLVRVQLKAGEDGLPVASPVMGRSGAISTLSRADGYFLIEEAAQGLNKDTEVEVYLLI